MQGVSGYTPGVYDNNYTLRLHYNQDYDIKKNQSVITVYAEAYHDANAFTYVDGRILINGATVVTLSAGAFPTGTVNPNNGWARVCYEGKTTEWQKTIDHNQDGTASIIIGISGFEFINGAYSYTHANFGSKLWNVTLTTIPRASSVSSASAVTIGSACNLRWTPNSSAFAYRLKFALGNWSYFTNAIVPGTTSEYTYTGYTIPMDVCHQLPSSASGTMTVTIYTYTDSNCVTQLGSESSTTFVVHVPDSVIPTISSVSAVLVNDNAVINDWGIAVTGRTNVNLSAPCSGAYGSSVVSFTITGGYYATVSGATLNWTGDAVTSSGDKTFLVQCTDSRGRLSAAVASNVIKFYDYANPIMQAFTVERDENIDAKMIVRVQWSISSVDGKNSASGVLQYKQSTQSAWTTYGEVPNGVATTLTEDFDTLHSYNFRIVVTDALGSKCQAESFASTMNVLLDFRAGNKGIGIGKICETDAVEVMLPTKFLGEVYVGAETLEAYVRRIATGG